MIPYTLVASEMVFYPGVARPHSRRCGSRTISLPNIKINSLVYLYLCYVLMMTTNNQHSHNTDSYQHSIPLCVLMRLLAQKICCNHLMSKAVSKAKIYLGVKPANQLLVKAYDTYSSNMSYLLNSAHFIFVRRYFRPVCERSLSVRTKRKPVQRVQTQPAANTPR